MCDADGAVVGKDNTIEEFIQRTYGILKKSLKYPALGCSTLRHDGS